MSSSYDVDPRLAGASTQRGLIPAKEHLEMDQNPLPGIAGMLIPFEFIYTISFILALNVNMALISFIVLFGTLMVGYMYPAQKRVSAKDRPGIPVRERVQLGPHLWEEQNRYIAVVPAVRPIHKMDISSMTRIIEERDLLIEEGGVTIIEGIPIDVNALRHARDMLLQAEDETEGSPMVSLSRKGINALLKKIWNIANEAYQMCMQNQRWFITGGIIASAIYVLSPLWLRYWYEILSAIGW
jgi:hypothetical protein